MFTKSDTKCEWPQHVIPGTYLELHFRVAEVAVMKNVLSKVVKVSVSFS